MYIFLDIYFFYSKYIFVSKECEWIYYIYTVKSENLAEIIFTDLVAHPNIFCSFNVHYSMAVLFNKVNHLEGFDFHVFASSVEITKINHRWYFLVLQYNDSIEKMTTMLISKQKLNKKIICFLRHSLGSWVGGFVIHKLKKMMALHVIT